MIPIQGAPAWATVGWVIALIVLILVVVFAILGSLDYKLALLLGGLAVARLL